MGLRPVRLPPYICDRGNINNNLQRQFKHAYETERPKKVHGHLIIFLLKYVFLGNTLILMNLLLNVWCHELFKNIIKKMFAHNKIYQ